MAETHDYLLGPTRSPRNTRVAWPEWRSRANLQRLEDDVPISAAKITVTQLGKIDLQIACMVIPINKWEHSWFRRCVWIHRRQLILLVTSKSPRTFENLNRVGDNSKHRNCSTEVHHQNKEKLWPLLALVPKVSVVGRRRAY